MDSEYKRYRATWIMLCILTVGLGAFLWAYFHGEAKAEPGVVPLVIGLAVAGHTILLLLMYRTKPRGGVRTPEDIEEEPTAGDEVIGPEYQVVLEFAGDDAETFERIRALQTKLDHELQEGEVDGNDVGLGITNIFLNTHQPEACFAEAMRILAGVQPQPRAAGFRNLEDDDYTRLLPKDDPTPFELK